MTTAPTRVCKFTDFGKDFSFVVENEHDIIQRHFVKGGLYEQEELEIIRSHADQCRVFYDIGSNVGNHAMFMAKVLGARKVYAFEANGRAARLLKQNVALNDLEGVIDTSHTGQGIGREHARLTVFNPQTNNLGAARLKHAAAPEEGHVEGYYEEVPVAPLDGLNIPDRADFVKIDVEGMELAVLDGMMNEIRTSRPTMFIEVHNSNQDDFLKWADDNDYSVRDTYSRYASNRNYLISPRRSGE